MAGTFTIRDRSICSNQLTNFGPIINRMLLLPILLTLLVQPTFAGEVAKDSPVMTWEQCIAEAAEKNPDILAATAAVKSAEALYSGSYSNFFPQLSASASYTDSSSGGNVTTTGPGGVILGTSSQGQYAAGLSATQNVFNGFQDTGKIKQGKANLEVARAALKIVKATLSAALKTQFAELLYEEANIDLNLSILKRQQNNLRLVTLRFEGGRENKGNQLFQAAQVSQAQYQYEHALRQLRAASKTLAASLGRPEMAQLKIKGEMTSKNPGDDLDFKAIALKSPTHLQAYYQQVAADAAVQVADSAWYPQVNLTGFVGKTGRNFPPDSNRWSVGAAISFPFFPGTSTIFNTESARSLRVKADYTMTSTSNNIVSGLENAYADLRDAIGLWNVAADFKKASQARSVIAAEKYNTGLMAFEDWSVIETDRVNREQTFLTNQRNAMQAEATWENAQGIGAIP